MDLTTTAYTLIKKGNIEIAVAAGESVKIETTSDDILREEVPAGKSWAVHISIYIEETDA